MKRIGALAGAVLMVIAAIVVRDVVTGDDTGTGPAASEDHGDVVVCATGLAPACTASLGDGTTTRAAGSTADALVDAGQTSALPGRAWIVPAPWAHLVIDERARLGRAPLFEIDGAPLASTTVVVAVWDDRAAQLVAPAGTCPGLTWRCLAEADGTTLSGGDRVATLTPDVDSAIGLAVAASQAASLLDRSDFAANDFDAAFRSLAARLAAAQTDSPLERMRSRGPGAATAAGVLAADTANLATTFGTIVTVSAEPAARIDVVALVPAGRGLPGSTRTALTDALLDAGWDAAGRGPDGLPTGSVLAAVRTLWNESR